MDRLRGVAPEAEEEEEEEEAPPPKRKKTRLRERLDLGDRHL